MKPSRRAAVPPFAVMSILNRVAELRAAGPGGDLALRRRAVSGGAVGRATSCRRADDRPYAVGLHRDLRHQAVASPRSPPITAAGIP